MPAQITFHVQDPTNPEATYLLEALVDAAAHAIRWRAVYAFATRGGVDLLLTDDGVEHFLKNGGKFQLIVGVDAVTNVAALQRLQEIADKTPGFEPRVFMNTAPGLFHPKFSHFSFADGAEQLVAGSGNLTAGGLRRNFEAYVVANGKAGEFATQLDAFIKFQTVAISEIDEAALARAAKNTVNLVKTKVAAPVGVTPPVTPPQPNVPEGIPVLFPTVGARVLVAYVPGAGGRWTQAHLNRAVIDEFFHVTNLKTQRVFLTGIRHNGSREQERVRPVIRSDVNENLKLEIDLGQGLQYPSASAGKPILVFAERQLRTFDYMLLMPDDPGYTQMTAVLTNKPSVGRGVARVIITTTDLASAWPQCPLLTSLPPDDAEV